MPDLPVDPDLGKWKFHRAIVVNQKNYVKLQIGMLINGTPEVGIKESGIIYYFHQSGKGHKRKGA
jgi:hypothetical protein